MSVNNLKIGNALIIAFSAMVIIVVALAGVVVSSLNRMGDAVAWNNHTYVVMDEAALMLASMVDQETGVRGYLVSGDKSFLEPYRGGQDLFAEQWAKLKDLTSDNPTQQERLDQIHDLSNTWVSDVAEREIALMSNPATVEEARALEASGAGKASMDGIRGLVDDFTAMEANLLAVREQARVDAANMAMMAMLGGAGLAVLFAVASWFLLSRRIAAPVVKLNECMSELAMGNNDVDVPGATRGDEIGQMAKAVLTFKEAAVEKQRMSLEAEEAQREREEARRHSDDEKAKVAAERAKTAADLESAVELLGQGLTRLATGDLTASIDQPFVGELDRLRKSYNDTISKFTEIVTSLKETSRGVKTATGEILSGANDLSERTTKQAATIEETSAAMEQLASTVVENAKKAESAAVKSDSASKMAEEGGEVMREANTAMERITNSSSKISNIIGMIDDIAFQTNLLALNASVEAARAGEAGKGFAVVAVEVRRLAQSAAEASSEVKVLIEQSADEVSGGSKLVASAADKLEAMLEAVRENWSLMRDIATASREQASAIEEVNTAVRQMDEMTQHNAALVEETNAAIEQTEARANELDRIVEVFVVSRSLAGRPAATANRTDNRKPSNANASRSLNTQGNAALKAEWEDF